MLSQIQKPAPPVAVEEAEFDFAEQMAKAAKPKNSAKRRKVKCRQLPETRHHCAPEKTQTTEYVHAIRDDLMSELGMHDEDIQCPDGPDPLLAEHIATVERLKESLDTDEVHLEDHELDPQPEEPDRP